jgi:serine protease Do
MKNKYVFSVILNFLLLIAFVGSIFFANIVSPKQIHTKTINSIVELKAEKVDLQSFGTAIVIDKNGGFITNYHVLIYTENEKTVLFENIYVRLSTEEEYFKVKFISGDSNKDLALLRLEENQLIKKFTSIGFGSTKVSIGDVCYAIGNMNSYSLSMSQGIVSNSSINIKINEIDHRFIQSNIDISNGSSGRALLYKYGKLIGVTTLRLRNSNGEVIQGFGYSIPLSVVKEFLS